MDGTVAAVLRKENDLQINEVQILLLAPNAESPTNKLYRLPIVRLIRGHSGSKRGTIMGAIQRLLGNQSKLMHLSWLTNDLNVPALNNSANASVKTNSSKIVTANDSSMLDMKIAILLATGGSSISKGQQFTGAGLKSEFLPILNLFSSEKNSGMVNSIHGTEVGIQSGQCIVEVRRWLDTPIANTLITDILVKPPSYSAVSGENMIIRTPQQQTTLSANDAHIQFQMTLPQRVGGSGPVHNSGSGNQQQQHEHQQHRPKNVQEKVQGQPRKSSSHPGSSIGIDVMQDQPAQPCRVVKNPFFRDSIKEIYRGENKFHWQSELVVVNPFWRLRPGPNNSRLSKVVSVDAQNCQGYVRSLYDRKRWMLRDCSWEKCYPLHAAAAKGDKIRVLQLLQQCGNKRRQLLLVGLCDWLGWTAMHYSISHGQLNVLPLLVQNVCLDNKVKSCNDDFGGRVSVNMVESEEHRSALQLAIEFDWLEVALWMLQNCPDIDVKKKNRHGETAADIAERKKDMKRILAEMKASTSLFSKLNRQTVYILGDSCKSRELILIRGRDTTLGELHTQLIDIFDLPYSDDDVFCFWLSVKKSRVIGVDIEKMISSPIPIQVAVEYGGMGAANWPACRVWDAVRWEPPDDNSSSSGSNSNISISGGLVFAPRILLWGRSVMLPLDVEQRIRHPRTVELLFGEAKDNFLRRFRYPCDDYDCVLMATTLMYMTLVTGGNKRSSSAYSINNAGDSNNSSSSKIRYGNRASSLNRPTSTTGNVPTSTAAAVPATPVRCSVDGTAANSFPDLHLNSRSSIFETRQRLAREFVSSEKNLASIFPKKTVFNKDNSWGDQVLNKFLNSGFSYKPLSLLDAKFRFLTLCWNFTLYGAAHFDIDLFVKVDLPSVSCIIAVNDVGIYLLKKRSGDLIQTFIYTNTNWTMSTNSANPSEGYLELVLRKCELEYKIRPRRTGLAAMISSSTGSGSTSAGSNFILRVILHLIQTFKSLNPSS